MKNAFNRLISGLDTAKERLSGLNTSITENIKRTKTEK